MKITSPPKFKEERNIRRMLRPLYFLDMSLHQWIFNKNNSHFYLLETKSIQFFFICKNNISNKLTKFIIAIEGYFFHIAQDIINRGQKFSQKLNSLKVHDNFCHSYDCLKLRQHRDWLHHLRTLQLSS